MHLSIPTQLKNKITQTSLFAELVKDQKERLKELQKICDQEKKPTEAKEQNNNSAEQNNGNNHDGQQQDEMAMEITNTESNNSVDMADSAKTPPLPLLPRGMIFRFFSYFKFSQL